MNSSLWKWCLSSCGSLVRAPFKILNSEVEQKDIAINEVLFYGGEDEHRTQKLGMDNLLCIHFVLMHASQTIDMCVPSLVSETIAKCLITVKKCKAIRVRVIIHNSDDFHNLQSFAQNGIEVKVIKTAERLEHEFVLIDAAAGGVCEELDAVAIIGSLDYETTRVNCNRDTTLLTSEFAVVSTLNKEFDRIWSVIGINE